MTSPAPRADGRPDDALRPVRVATGTLEYAEGSALVEFGGTKVLCAATVEDGVPDWKRSQGVPGGWVTAEYAMLPRANRRRSRRERGGVLSGRTQEIQRIVGRSLRAVTDLAVLGVRTVTLDCDVLQADGGTRVASVTGAFVALALAVHRLLGSGTLKRSPLRDSVAGVSVGLAGRRLLLDLAFAEDSKADVDCNVVATGSGRLVEVQATAEGDPFPRDDLAALVDLALAGCAALAGIQREALVAAGCDPAALVAAWGGP